MVVWPNESVSGLLERNKVPARWSSLKDNESGPAVDNCCRNSLLSFPSSIVDNRFIDCGFGVTPTRQPK